MNRVKQAFIGVFLVIILVIPLSSHALKSKHLFDDMDGKESAKFVSGMVTMLQYLQYRLGKPERGECIYNWYFKDKKTPLMVVDFMHAYPDKEAEAIVYVLAKVACFQKNEDVKKD